MFSIRAWVGVLFLVCSSAIRLGKRGFVVSIEELQIKLTNLLIIPDTMSIHRFIIKHPSRMFPSFRCERIENCFSDEILALKTALLESSGDTDNKRVAGQVEDITGSQLNKKLKKAVRQINKNRPWLNRKKTYARLTNAIDYFLNAFYFARARLSELRGTPEQQRIALGVISILLDEAANLARDARNHYPIRLDWLHDIREYRQYTHMKLGWQLWRGKKESYTLYTVPIANLGSTFMSLWAIGKYNHKLSGLSDLNVSGLVEQTRDYWKAYPRIARKCTQDQSSLKTCLELTKLGSQYPNALTVDKAKFIVAQFARYPLESLSLKVGDIIRWVSDGAEPEKNPLMADSTDV